MCKIAVFPHVDTKHEKNAWRLAKALVPLMTLNDNDGFGFMALGPKGPFGSRWLDVDDAFKPTHALDPSLKSAIKGIEHALDATVDSNSFGTPSAVSCLALHARMATSGQGLANTHPFVTPTGDAVLIHNGVINSPDPSEMPTSTCDSEVILTKYSRHNVANDAPAIDKVSQELEGYFACAVLAKNTQGQWILDIFKDARANLEAVYVPQVGGLVFCTQASMIIDACHKLGWRTKGLFQVNPCWMMRWDAVTGATLGELQFKAPRVRTYVPPIARTYSDYSIADDDGPIDPLEIRNRLEALEYEAYRDDDKAELTDAALNDPYYYKRGA